MKPDKPIVTSQLNRDFYDFTVWQLANRFHPDVPVTLQFINRSTHERLGDMLDLGRLREELDEARRVPFNPNDLQDLMGICEYDRPMFSIADIRALEKVRLPEYELGKTKDGQLDLRFHGPWPSVLFWENPSMQIPNHLRSEYLMGDRSRFERKLVYAEGRLRLGQKIKELRKYPDIKFSDFGTRRSFNHKWHQEVVETLMLECGDQFVGTSNVFLAKHLARKHKREVMPMGTNNHGMVMVYNGIYHTQDDVDPTFSSRKVLEDWESIHGDALTIFLSDTWSSPWFFKNVVTDDMLRRWKGFRHDSGSPIVYGKDRIAGYKKLDVDPMKKISLFADGNTVTKMIDIRNYFYRLLNYTFGWGTDESNDLGFPTASIVTKPIFVNGIPVCKLSDNIKKASGDPRAIERVKKLIGYDNTFEEVCTF